MLAACSAEKVWHCQWAHLSSFPKGFVPSLKYVVDVGANDGCWSKVFMGYTRPERWLAVEPDAAMANNVVQALKEYPFARTERCALADANGEREFFISQHSHNSSLLAPLETAGSGVEPGFETKRVEKVPVRTLDSLVGDWPRVDLLKIDVQGFEVQVLAGAKETLKKTEAVLVEANFTQQYAGGSLFSDVHQVLESEGMRLWSIFPPANHHGRLIWADAFYVRPGSRWDAVNS